ncbi:MAG: 3-keto-disaccharide hydrolase [Actinomycetota bacterium]
MTSPLPPARISPRSRSAVAIGAVVLLTAIVVTGGRAAGAADTSAPVTSHTISPAVPGGLDGWYLQSPVNVSLSADDTGGSGVISTEFRIDGGQWLTYGGLAPEEVLFDGTQASLDRWRQAGPGSFRLLPDGTILSQGGLGMLWYPGKEYGDAVFKLEFRDAKPGTGDTGSSNSGVFIRFPQPDEAVALPPEERYPCQVGSGQSQPAWAAIYCGHEIQLFDGVGGDAQKTGSVYNFKPLNRTQAMPTMQGDWNTYEVRTVGGGDYSVTVTRNGQVINEWKNSPGQNSSRAGDPPTDLRQFASGFFGIQNHGSSDYMQFRNIRVQDLTPLAPIRISQPGEHTIEYRSTDAEGNVEDPKSVVVKVDPAAPTTTATLDPPTPNGSGGAYSTPVSVGLSKNDVGSGVARTEYRVDGGEWQTYEVPEKVIFDGTPESFAQWRQAPSGSFALLEDGSIQSVGGLGMLWYPVEAYGDAALKVEFRDMRADSGYANSGVFMRFPKADGTGPGNVAGRYPCEAQGRPAWVAIYCGHEIQIYDGPTGETQKTGSIYNFAPRTLEQAQPTEKGVWNEYEVRTVGGGAYTITVIRNGKVINEFVNAPSKLSSRPGDPPTDMRQNATGYVGLQNHGNADVIQFRNIRVEDLSPGAGAFTVSGSGLHTVQFRSIDVAGNVEAIRQVSFRIE